MAAKYTKEKDSWKQYLTNVDAPGLKLFYKISNVGFAVFYVALIAALIVLGLKFLDYCRESFVMYENSQLSYAVDGIMAQLNDADADRLSELLYANAPDATVFDDPAASLAAKYENLAAKELTCKEIPGYDKDGHSYALYSDGIRVGEFTVTAGNEETRLGLLTITEWHYGSGEVEFKYDSIERSWRVPEGFVVVVNGISLGDEFISAGPEPIDAFEYFIDYTDMPGMVTYSVAGLLEEPSVVILNNLGEAVQIDPSAETVELAEEYAPSVIPAELENDVIEVAKLWCNYSLRDATLDEIIQVLIKDSLLYKQVLDSNRDRNYIDSHFLVGYDNEQVLKYIRYNDNCFACRVYMERTVQLTRNGEQVSDRMDMIFYFVQLDLSDNGIDDPVWYIADVLAAG